MLITINKRKNKRFNVVSQQYLLLNNKLPPIQSGLYLSKLTSYHVFTFTLETDSSNVTFNNLGIETHSSEPALISANVISKS